MRPEGAAVFAVDDRAAGGTGVALVGSDQFERVAEQFDMLVIDRGPASLERADQADRLQAAADAGLEHDELASALPKMQAGQCKQRLEGAEALAALARNGGDGGLTPCPRARKGLIADLGFIDPDPLIEAQQMRRGEQPGPQAPSAP